MAKRKTQKIRNTYESIDFDTTKLFPPGRNLGNHILGLMAVLNDLTFIDLAITALGRPNKGINEHQLKIFTGKKFFLFRLNGAFLYEALKLIEDISNQREFKDQMDFMDQSGKNSLKELLLFKRGETGRILKKTRNSITFHNDRGFSIGGLMDIRAANKGAYKAQIVKKMQKKSSLPELENHYYLFADALRYQYVFGTPEHEKMQNLQKILDRIAKCLHIFFCSLFNAYQEKGNICAFDGGILKLTSGYNTV
jgi:hypothetical protein